MSVILDLSRQSISNSDFLEILKNHEFTVKIVYINETPISSLYPVTRVSLNNLVELDITLTNIDNLYPLKYLINLKILRANQLTLNNIDSLVDCQNLEKLSLEYCQIHKFNAIPHLNNLKCLILTGNKWFTDLSSLTNMLALKEIYIQATGINTQSQLLILKDKNLTKLVVDHHLISTAEALLHSCNFNK